MSDRPTKNQFKHMSYAMRAEFMRPKNEDGELLSPEEIAGFKARRIARLQEARKPKRAKVGNGQGNSKKPASVSTDIGTA